MARLTGRNVHITWQGTAITSYYRSFDAGVAEEFAETTAAGDNVRNHAPLDLIALEPNGTFVVDWTVGSAVLLGLRTGQTGTLEWAPFGTQTGKPRWAVVAEISESNVSFTHDSEQELSVTWMPTQGTLLYDGRTAVY